MTGNILLKKSGIALDHDDLADMPDVGGSISDHDGRYYTEAEIGSTTGGSEGASLVGTDTKTNLNNATDVETALTQLNSWIDQDVTSGSSPTFDGANFTGIDISGATNLSVTSPITLTDDDIGFDFSTNNTWTGTNEFQKPVSLIMGTSEASLPLDILGSKTGGNCQLRLSNVDTDLTNKVGCIILRNYDNAERDVTVFGGATSNTLNLIGFGGGQGNEYAATSIFFYTAANNKTLGGTLNLSLSSTLLTSEVKQVIDVTDPEAFLVRKNSDAGDVFVVDTTNDNVEVEADLIPISNDTWDLGSSALRWEDLYLSGDALIGAGGLSGSLGSTGILGPISGALNLQIESLSSTLGTNPSFEFSTVDVAPSFKGANDAGLSIPSIDFSGGIGAIRNTLYLLPTGTTASSQILISPYDFDLVSNDVSGEIRYTRTGAGAGNLLLCVTGTDNFMDFRAEYFTFNNDLFFTGAGSGLPFGSFYGNNIGWTSTSFGGGGTFVIINTLTTGANLNLTTFQNTQELLIAKTGKYLVIWSASVEVAVANKHIEVAPGINGTANVEGRQHVELASANKEESIAGTAILPLTATNTLSLMLTNVDDNTAVEVHHVNLTATQIGG